MMGVMYREPNDEDDLRNMPNGRVRLDQQTVVGEFTVWTIEIELRRDSKDPGMGTMHIFETLFLDHMDGKLLPAARIHENISAAQDGHLKACSDAQSLTEFRQGQRAMSLSLANRSGR
jgi:hypothetical protein